MPKCGDDDDDDDGDVDDHDACRSFTTTCQNFRVRRLSSGTRDCRKRKLPTNSLSNPHVRVINPHVFHGIKFQGNYHVKVNKV